MEKIALIGCIETKVVYLVSVDEEDGIRPVGYCLVIYKVPAGLFKPDNLVKTVSMRYGGMFSVDLEIAPGIFKLKLKLGVIVFMKVVTFNSFYFILWLPSCSCMARTIGNEYSEK